MALLAAVLSSPAAHSGNSIQLENGKPGTQTWQLANPALNHEIEGYASLTSVNRGGQIKFFVNTADTNYTIEIFRMGWYAGLGGRQIKAPMTQTGNAQPPTVPDAVNGSLIECNWTHPYVLDIPNNPSDPTDWCSGIYLAKLTGSWSGKQSYIVFTVRDDERPSDYLFQSSVTTWQAYNSWGGNGLYYHSPSSCSIPAAQKVSFNRPYERTSGYPGVEFYVGAGELFTRHLAYTLEYCDPAARGHSPAAWEYNMMRFLEREGYDVTYCTDVDVHENATLLFSHRGFLSVGHDEYWSREMRDNVEAARDAGVNLGFFSANTCYWQIRFEPSTITRQANRTMVCYKDADADPLGPTNPLVTVRWRSAPVNRPENTMIGVMHNIYPADDDLVVIDPSHWVFTGTGVQRGDHIPGVVGYEADGTFPGGPIGLEVLAHSPPRNASFSEMTVYRAASGAFVFATGSIQWAWGLDDYNADAALGLVLRTSRLNSSAQQMTRNVLNHFLKATPIIVWTNPAAIVYGTPLTSEQLGATANVPGTFSYNPPAGSVLGAGAYQTLTVIFLPTDSTNYAATKATVTLSVSPALLTVRANKATRRYGDPNPMFGTDVIGLRNGDEITVTNLCAATSNSPPGSYEIVPVLIDPAGRLANYQVTLIEGALTVIPLENILAASIGSGPMLLLSVETVAGAGYVLEFKEILADTTWNVSQSNLGTGSLLTFTNFVGSNGSGFYRLRIE